MKHFSLIKNLLFYHKNKLKRYFEIDRFAKILTSTLFILVLGWVGIGIFFFFKRGFHYLTKIMGDSVLSQKVIPLFMYETFWLILTFLVLFSALIMGLFQLFRSKKDTWFVTTPKFKILPYYALIRVFLTSIYPILILGIPALFAIKHHFGISGIELLISFFSLILLVLFCTLLTQIFLLLLGKILLHQKLISLKKGFVFGILGVGILSLFTLYQIFSLDLFQLLGTKDASQFELIQQTIITNFHFFPSHFSVMTLFYFQENLESKALYSLGILLGSCGVLSFIFYYFSRFYLSIWQAFSEGSEPLKTLSNQSKNKPFPRFFQNPLGAFFEKEALINIRNPQNFFWFGFLWFLWLIQIGANFFLNTNMEKHGFDSEKIMTVSLVLQLATTVFFMSAFVLRFVFPSFSLEGKSAWILAHSPLNMTKIFWAKFLFYGLIFIFIGLSAGALNFSMLDLSFDKLTIPFIFLGLTILFITALGLCLGSLFPNFESEDPQIITTSLSGLFFTFCTFGYGGFGIKIFHDFLKNGETQELFLFFSLSIFVAGSLLWFTQNSIKRMEFE